MDARVGSRGPTIPQLSAEGLILLNCGAREDSWESLGQQGDQTSQSKRKSTLNIHWKDWDWCWRSNSLAPCCEEPTHWKRPRFWERLRVGGKEGNRGWDDWMETSTQWVWVWADSRGWWRTGKPGVPVESVESTKSWTRLSNWITTMIVLFNFLEELPYCFL